MERPPSIEEIILYLLPF